MTPVEALECRTMLSAITVNSTSDSVNNSIITGPTVTLREAINHANADAPGDTITFASSLSGKTIKLNGNELAITNSMTITGLGAGQLTINGSGTSRIFDLDSTTTQHVTITGLTLQNASDTAGNGGGAIAVGQNENLTLAANIIENSAANIGGGIFNLGTLTSMNNTISGNSAIYGGGGIFNSGILRSTNDTIHGNSAIGGGSSGSGGGGIYNRDLLTTTNDTIDNNSATGTLYAGGGVYELGATWNSINTVVADNPKDGDIFNNNGDVTAFNSLSGDGSGFSSGNGNIRNPLNQNIFVTSGGVPVLANNGGPTPTVALASGSPALGAGRALATLANSVNDTVTSTLNVTGVPGLAGTAFLAVGDVIQMDSERMLVTNIISNQSISVSRGYGGSLATTHQAGAAISLAFDQRGANRTSPSDIGAYQPGTITPIITVTSASDTPQIGLTTLRQAIAESNSDPTVDEIDFALPKGTTIVLTHGELTITNSVLICGPGANSLTISGNKASRIFDVNAGGSAANANLFVSISGLTLANGDGIAATNSGEGGAIYNAGQLTLKNDAINNNTASGYGGGIFNQGQIISSSDTFASNSSSFGGALDNNTGANFNSTYDTFWGNTAYFGGAIKNLGILTTTNDTITANNALIYGGGLFVDGTWNSLNTIVAGNLVNSKTPSDIYLDTSGKINAKNSLIGNAATSGGIVNGVNGNIVGKSTQSIFVTNSMGIPMLANNGGTTQTVALAAGSPGLGMGS